MKTHLHIYFACFLLFCCYLLFTAILFLNKNSNKNCLIKKYFIQKIEITPKRLEIGIHNVNKSGFKIKFYTYI
jgi:hypothetical protein